MSDKPTTAVQKKEPATLKDLVSGDQFKQQVANVLPKHITPERFVRVALTAMLKTPRLMECDQKSFFNALLSLSQMGLEPDGRRAHLVPFKNTKRNIVECQLIVDYKGLAELVMRSGLVSNIHGDVVCEADVFEYDRGELKKHTIDFRKPRIDAYCVYSLVRFKDGTEKCEVMTVDEVEAVRKRSKSSDDGPWVTDWREMAKKTVFKRLAKWLPLTPDVKDAIERDDDSSGFEGSIPVESTVETKRQIAPVAFAPVEDEIPMGVTKPAGSSPAQGASPAQSSPPTVVDADEADKATDVPGKAAPETTAPAATNLQSGLCEVLEGAGVSFEDFRDWLGGSGKVKDASALTGWMDIPDKVCVALQKSPKELAAVVKLYGRKEEIA